MNLQLAIGAVVALVIAGLVATAAIYRGNAISAEADATRARADLATAVSVNKANEEALGRLRADKEKSDRLAADLADQVRTSNQALIDATDERRTLENENDDIHKFLAQRIPDALRLRPVQGEAAGDHR
jgi:hypothetical protein